MKSVQRGGGGSIDVMTRARAMGTSPPGQMGLFPLNGYGNG